VIDKEIKEALNYIDSLDSALLKDGPYTVQLVDESDPDGFVEFKNKNGVVCMSMPRQDYEDFIKWKTK
jgi:hypothetical protein